MILWVAAVLLSACGNDEGHIEYYYAEGETQGTTYHITWFDSTHHDPEILKAGIKKILSHIDTTFSTYIESSLVSRFNISADSVEVNEDFINVLVLSRRINKLTNGAFDPTLSPVINAYGFGPKGLQAKIEVDSIEALMRLVGLNHIIIQNNFIKKDTTGVALDFNAIAQGYTVDLLADYFNKNGIHNYLIEVGGELIAKGKKMDGSYWMVGIDKPKNELEERQLIFKLPLFDKSIATSGNYRKFYVQDGKKVTHTINPKTGESVVHQLLSATIISDTCAVSDALATSMMVLGKDSSINFLQKHKEYDGILIFENELGKMEYFITPGLKEMVEKLN